MTSSNAQSAAQAAGSCSMHFLSSGSSGNCMLLKLGDTNVLIDFGLPPQTFVELLRAEGIALDYWREKRAGASTKKPKRAQDPTPEPFSGQPLTAALLTHTHGDHFSPSTMRILKDNHVRLWTHRGHLPDLGENASFRKLREAGHVEHYDDGHFQPAPNIRALPLKLPHDSTATHGFMLEITSPDQRFIRIGYAADMGFFPEEHVDALANCDVLALEFNHDVAMERQSNRHPRSIERVLGKWGHLSNEQGANALRAILAKPTRVKPHCVALLHLSRDCNHPDLAENAAARVLKEFGLNSRILVTRHRQSAGSVDMVGRQIEPPIPLAGSPAPTGGARRRFAMATPDLFGHE